jgi:hypothetical protein
MALRRRVLLSAPLWPALARAQAGTGAASPSATPAPELLEQLRALGLRSAPVGRLGVWFPPEQQPRAMALGLLVDGAANFFHDQLAIDGQLHLALLTREHWAALIPWQPYGIPGVAGRPPVVFMPAGDDGLAAEDALALHPRVASATLQALAAAGYGYETASRRYVDLVGLHELGHAYARRYGIWANCRWLDEMVATYFAYAYLREKHPRLVPLWDGVLQAYVDAVRPTYTSLEDFDRLYFGVGAQNYVWYQAQFQRRVREVFAARGLDFLVDLRMRFGTPSPVALAPQRILQRLEALLPGFIAWANSLAR